jgi:hypothetical protein
VETFCRMCGSSKAKHVSSPYCRKCYECARCRTRLQVVGVGDQVTFRCMFCGWDSLSACQLSAKSPEDLLSQANDLILAQGTPQAMQALILKDDRDTTIPLKTKADILN